MQKTLFCLLMAWGLSHSLSAQAPDKAPIFERKGLTVGLSIGAGILTLSANDTVRTMPAATFPNLRLGCMISRKLALQLLIPGSTYRHEGRQRGFEGFLLTAQYWPRDRWWILGGAGVAFDAPAFWTVKDFRTADFYSGLPAVAFATGYEILRKKHLTLDIQYRLYAGQVSTDSKGKKQGVTNMLSLGINWY